MSTKVQGDRGCCTAVGVIWSHKSTERLNGKCTKQCIIFHLKRSQLPLCKGNRSDGRVIQAIYLMGDENERLDRRNVSS